MTKKRFEDNLAQNIFSAIEKGFSFVSTLISGKPKCASELASTIERKLSEINSLDDKSKIIEYDKLTSYTLTKMGVRGETFSQKRKNYKKYIRESEYRDIWRAHIVRNKISHEIDYNPPLNELKDAQIKFYKFLRRVKSE